MRGVLLVPSSSPALSPIYDGLGVNVTSNITWFHLNYDMVSRRIYNLSFYGGHFITIWPADALRNGWEHARERGPGTTVEKRKLIRSVMSYWSSATTCWAVYVGAVGMILIHYSTYTLVHRRRPL